MKKLIFAFFLMCSFSFAQAVDYSGVGKYQPVSAQRSNGNGHSENGGSHGNGNGNGHNDHGNGNGYGHDGNPMGSLPISGGEPILLLCACVYIFFVLNRKKSKSLIVEFKKSKS